MKKFTLIFTTLLVFTMSLTAQSQPGFASSTNSNHRQAMSQYEGAQPMPFQAFDMEGKTHFLPEYKGKVLVMAFWATGDETSRDQIKSLNQIRQEFISQGVEVISFAEEDKQDLVSFLKNNQIEYPVIPNSKPLGEMGYGSEFGTSRIFVVDRNGVVQKVLVVEKEEEMATYNALKPIVKKLAN